MFRHLRLGYLRLQARLGEHCAEQPLMKFHSLRCSADHLLKIADSLFELTLPTSLDTRKVEFSCRRIHRKSPVSVRPSVLIGAGIMSLLHTIKNASRNRHSMARVKPLASISGDERIFSRSDLRKSAKAGRSPTNVRTMST